MIKDLKGNIINIRLFSEEIFYALSGFLLISAILEIIWPRIILAYVNLNIVLFLWLINVIILLVISKKKS